MSGDALARLEIADRRARLAAQTVFDRPVVLEAGAGTGKTTALVGRTVAWALDGGWARAEAEESELRERAGRAGPPDAERVAARVLDGTVAITCTEAAAAEMASRIGIALRELAAGRLPVGVLADGLGSDAVVRRERARALLTALDHLRVSTIHAFCRRLLASYPLEAGVHPAFRVDPDERLTEATVDAVVEERYREALAGAGDADVLRLAAAGWGPDAIGAAILELCRTAVPAVALADGERWRREAGDLLSELGVAARRLAALLGERLPPTSRVGKAREVADACARLERACSGGHRRLDETQAVIADRFDDNLRQKLQEWRRGKLTRSEAEALGADAGELALLSGFVRETTGYVGRLDEPLFASGARVVGAWLEAVRARLRRDGVAGFGDLLHGCRDLLLSAPAVVARERRSIRQLLVDEFQDTDAVQCEILAALGLGPSASDRPGLFLVGDPKQSIYGWRQADLAAYQAFTERVLSEGGELHRLSVNFRSVEAILAEVERAVRPVMRPEPGLQPAFEPLLVGPPGRAKAGLSAGGRGAVEFWVTPEPGGGGEDEEIGELEPRAVAADIRDLHDRHGVPWGEFAILMRSTGDLDAYLHALREAAVPYLVERDRSYYRRREVIDASALIRAVLDPLDHLALLTWMRSASVGVPDAALLPLWQRGFPELMTELRGENPEALARIAEVVAMAAAATPSVPGLELISGWEASLNAAAATLGVLRASFARDPAAVFVERLRTISLLEATEAARVLGRYRVANLDRLFRMLLDEVDRQGGDPEAILAALRRAVAERREEEEGRLREQVTEAVRVMTIHKAKGLDFGHVYVVNADRKMLDERVPVTAAAAFDGAWHAVLFGSPSPGWRRVVARRRRVAEAELVRTLYVAMTRAKTRLVVAGRWEKARRDTAAPSHLSLLCEREGGVTNLDLSSGPVADRAVLWVPLATGPSTLEGTPATELEPGLPGRAEVEAAQRALDALAAEAGQRMARPFTGAASNEAHRRLREALSESADDAGVPALPRGSRAAMEAATEAGTAVHLLLERLDFETGVTAQMATWPELLAWMMAGRPEALARALALVARLRESPLPARLEALAGSVLSRELPIIVPPSGEGPVGAVIGAIDLLYRDPESGAVVVADFKTDRVEGAELAARADAYRPQVESYASAVGQALGLAAPPVMELWFLHAGLVIRLES